LIQEREREREREREFRRGRDQVIPFKVVEIVFASNLIQESGEFDWFVVPVFISNVGKAF